MKNTYQRRNFIKTTVSARIGTGVLSNSSLFAAPVAQKGKRIGIIGLDTSHVIAFTKEFNSPTPSADFDGYKVVAAYPKGSSDIESSYKRIPGYTEEIKKMGVEIVDSIKQLLGKVDFVLLETNDGRLHLEQAMEVLKAGKTMFIDKPMAASLKDAMIIFKEAEKRKVPIFSSSSMRFLKGTVEAAQGKGGKILGAFGYSPAHLEVTHPDFFWYGIHGVETLFTVMGTGCKDVVRVSGKDHDTVVGTWNDGRIGTFTGIRAGRLESGGTAFCEKAVLQLGSNEGYRPMLVEIVKFFNSGIPPVKAEDTIEVLAFMEAADESKRLRGASVSMESIIQKAKKAMG